MPFFEIGISKCLWPHFKFSILATDYHLMFRILCHASAFSVQYIKLLEESLPPGLDIFFHCILLNSASNYLLWGLYSLRNFCCFSNIRNTPDKLNECVHRFIICTAYSVYSVCIDSFTAQHTLYTQLLGKTIIIGKSHVITEQHFILRAEFSSLCKLWPSLLCSLTFRKYLKGTLHCGSPSESLQTVTSPLLHSFWPFQKTFGNLGKLKSSHKDLVIHN